MIHKFDNITYSSVVIRETVHIALTMDVVHDLRSKQQNLLKAYVVASNREYLCATLGPEFGDHACKSAIIVRALYGLNIYVQH